MELVRLTRPIDPLSVLDVLLARPDLWVVIPVVQTAESSEYLERLWHTVQFAPAIRTRVALGADTEEDLLGCWALIALEGLPVVTEARMPPLVSTIEPSEVAGEAATAEELYALAGKPVPVSIDEDEA